MLADLDAGFGSLADAADCPETGPAAPTQAVAGSAEGDAGPKPRHEVLGTEDVREGGLSYSAAARSGADPAEAAPEPHSPRASAVAGSETAGSRMISFETTGAPDAQEGSEAFEAGTPDLAGFADAARMAIDALGETELVSNAPTAAFRQIRQRRRSTKPT